MTQEQIAAQRQAIERGAVALSEAAVTALNRLEAVTEELNAANTTIALRDRTLAINATTITEANRTISNLRNDLATRGSRVTATNLPSSDPQEAPRMPAEITQGFSLQPRDLDTSKVVRFLSKNSSGGLANIRASLNDAGINAKRLRLEGSSFTPSNDTLVINWGGGFEVPSNLSGFTGRTLNKLDAVKIAANKLKTLQALKANAELVDNTPNFCTAPSDTTGWAKVYCRETLFGHSGEGITVKRGSERKPVCPLYVEGLNVKHEYRVHTVNGFTKIQKKAKLETANPNMEVRNLAGGWTFINDFTLGDRGRSQLHDLSIKVIDCLGLDFGAVDVVRTEEGTWQVLEVNTAPGVTADSNIEWYTKALLSI